MSFKVIQGHLANGSDQPISCGMALGGEHILVLRPWVDIHQLYPYAVVQGDRMVA